MDNTSFNYLCHQQDQYWKMAKSSTLILKLGNKVQKLIFPFLISLQPCLFKYPFRTTVENFVKALFIIELSEKKFHDSGKQSFEKNFKRKTFKDAQDN